VNQFQAASQNEHNKSNPEKALLARKAAEANPNRKVHVEGGRLAVGGLAEAFQTATQAKQEASANKPLLCRTAESNPVNHNKHHHGLFYTIPEAEHKIWSAGCHPHVLQMAKAFGEMGFMVRQPGLELCEYMNAASYNLPVIRYVLHGRWGNGKTSTLSYAMHAAAKKGWMILHLPWGQDFNRHSKECVPSAFKPGRFDQPADAVKFLSYFRDLNSEFLAEHELKLAHSYIWNRRETSEEGSPLVDALDFGITRPKYASDVVGLLVKEIRTQASDGKFQVLVAVDGVNALWTASHHKREEDRTIKIHASEMSNVVHMKKLLSNDWSGGAVVCTVDTKAGELSAAVNHMPRYLLGKEGFDFFDPHIPIHVPHYSSKETNSHLDYYTENGWIQSPAGLTDAGRKEITFLSCNNPFELYHVTQGW